MDLQFIKWGLDMPIQSLTLEPLEVSSAPNGSTVVGDIHTHAAYDSRYINNEFSGKQATSSSNKLYTNNNYDIGQNNNDGTLGFLTTPSGTLQKYDNNTGVISILNSNSSSDINDPNKVNSNGSGPTTVNYTIRKGDTISDISDRFNVNPTEIITENKIKNANDIKIGQKINVTD